MPCTSRFLRTLGRYPIATSAIAHTLSVACSLFHRQHAHEHEQGAGHASTLTICFPSHFAVTVATALPSILHLGPSLSSTAFPFSVTPYLVQSSRKPWSRSHSRGVRRRTPKAPATCGLLIGSWRARKPVTSGVPRPVPSSLASNASDRKECATSSKKPPVAIRFWHSSPLGPPVPFAHLLLTA